MKSSRAVTIDQLRRLRALQEQDRRLLGRARRAVEIRAAEKVRALEEAIQRGARPQGESSG